MNDLKAVSAMVKSILAEDTQARNDDNVLYLKVLQIVSNRNSIDLQSMTVPVFLLKMKEYGLPGFETVRRSRQKVQADNPDLAGNAAVRRKRAKSIWAIRMCGAAVARPLPLTALVSYPGSSITAAMDGALVV